MTPEIYEDIALYNANCVDVLAEFPNDFFDLAIVDPPYGIGADKPSKKPELVKQRNGEYLKVKSVPYSSKNWDIVPDIEYFNQLFRVSKNQIVWGCNYFPHVKFKSGRIVWDKMNGLSDQYGCEIAYQSFNNRTDIVHYMWSGMFQGVRCSMRVEDAICQQGNKKLNEKRIHPTQKPVKLYKWLLSHFAKKGDKILDTHLGSGSICIACHDLGFEMVGIEIDSDYFNDAKTRLIKHQAQKTLFRL